MQPGEKGQAMISGQGRSFSQADMGDLPLVTLLSCYTRLIRGKNRFNFRMISSELPGPAAAELKRFEIRDGNVVGDTSEEDALHFAADFQGLRHFGQKIGEALDLGDPWLGAFREADFTHLWAYTGNATSATDPGNGVVIPRHAPLVELLEDVFED